MWRASNSCFSPFKWLSGVVHLGNPFRQSMDWGSVFCPLPAKRNMGEIWETPRAEGEPPVGPIPAATIQAEGIRIDRWLSHPMPKPGDEMQIPRRHRNRRAVDRTANIRNEAQESTRKALGERRQTYAGHSYRYKQNLRSDSGPHETTYWRSR